jgi:hypothetical protein
MSYRHRQQWGCGTFFALALILGAIVAYWYIAVPVLVVLVIGAITIGSAKRRQPQRTPTPALEPRAESGLSPALEVERQELYGRLEAMSANLMRLRFRSRCDYCGAPRRHRAEFCRYCGRSLLVA